MHLSISAVKTDDEVVIEKEQKFCNKTDTDDYEDDESDVKVTNIV